MRISIYQSSKIIVSAASNKVCSFEFFSSLWYQIKFVDLCYHLQSTNLKRNQTKNSYNPKQSKRIKKSLIKILKDGDTWTEHILVDTKRKTIRSYFESQNTGNLVWNEPPSGGTVILAPLDVIVSIEKTLNSKI